ncbi:MAG: hypothetical protein FWD11_11910, partial [Micrococcales bacterium]|nr:hypothetical protein [Micrococcales bacterium]
MVGEWEADLDSLAASMGMDSASGSLTFRFGTDDFETRWNVTLRETFLGDETEQWIDATFTGTWSGPDDDLTLVFSDITGTSVVTTNGTRSSPVDIGAEL